jgi:hypothetical protein
MQHTNKKINSTIETFKEWGMMENLDLGTRPTHKQIHKNNLKK